MADQRSASVTQRTSSARTDPTMRWSGVALPLHPVVRGYLTTSAKSPTRK